MYTAHQYRLVGPGAWSGARQAVLEIIDRLQYPVNATAVDSKRQQCANESKQWQFMTAAAAVAAVCLATAFFNNAVKGLTF
jgi:anti-sigma-K factor RskA